jgi:hypothetical protein
MPTHDTTANAQQVIKGAVEWMSWILRFPENPAAYPAAIREIMPTDAASLAPLSAKHVDRAASFLAQHLWQVISRRPDELEEGEVEGVLLFETSEHNAPDEALRLMGEAVGLDARQLAQRLPAYLSAYITPEGVGVLHIWWARYAVILVPELPLAPGSALVGFDVLPTEQVRAVLRELGATFSADGCFIDLSGEDQKQRAALFYASGAHFLRRWELFRHPAQGWEASGAQLYEVMNGSNDATGRDWLAWIIAGRSCDFPHEAVRSLWVRGGYRAPARARERSLALHEDVAECRPERLEVLRGVREEEGEQAEEAAQEVDTSPFAAMREGLVEQISRFTYAGEDEEWPDVAALARFLEVEGALERWQRALAALAGAVGADEAERLVAYYAPNKIVRSAMLASALVGRADLVLAGEGATSPTLPEIPPAMAWVWGIRLSTIELAGHAKQFIDFAGLFHLQNRFEITFVGPDGRASDCPLLYGVTPAGQAVDQFRWLATGDGRIPL